MQISQVHFEELKNAKSTLENPGLAAKLSDRFGGYIESGVKALPDGMSRMINKVVRVSLERALQFAVYSLGKKNDTVSDITHRLAALAAGAAGGFGGFITLAVELPATTVLMLRSIADIAAQNGEDLTKMESRLACLEVFSLGGSSVSDDGAETGYFAVRLAVSGFVRDAAADIAVNGLRMSSNAVVRMFSKLAERFGIVVSDKVAAQMLPVIGAAGGAFVNVVFMDHLQKMAHAHFTIRRLERIYGSDEIKATYLQIQDTRGV